MTPDEEKQLIWAEARKQGVDPCFILAVRRAENGPAGREWGVLSVSAPDFNSQLQVCCNSVRHRLIEYKANPLGLELTTRRLIYNTSFIKYFASIWAPIGADNDDNNLNANWPTNVISIYLQLASDDVDSSL